jgi:hypothetical protein
LGRKIIGYARRTDTRSAPNRLARLGRKIIGYARPH